MPSEGQCCGVCVFFVLHVGHDMFQSGLDTLFLKKTLSGEV